MDKFTLEEIEAAFNEIPTGDAGYTSLPVQLIKEQIMKELTRPKHSFREGEVVFIGDRYMLYGRQDYAETSKQPWKPARPLTLSEMPKAVEDLREAVKRIPNETVINGTHGIEMLRDMAEEALAAFDSEISHE